AIIASTNPLVLALVAPKLLGEALTTRKVIGLALGFGGVVGIMVARAGTQTALPADVALSFVGVISSVASTLLFKRKRSDVDLVVFTAWQLVAAGLELIPFALLREGVPHVVLTATLGWSFVYLVLVLSIGASLMWFWLLTHGEASKVSAYYYLTPVFGLALSAALLGEHVGPRDLLGLVAIAAGIALVQRAGARDRAAEPAA
ncbi:MAG: DMT family transporter, partial [Vulcanimicrobiaceae bacterium]